MAEASSWLGGILRSLRSLRMTSMPGCLRTATFMVRGATSTHEDCEVLGLFVPGLIERALRRGGGRGDPTKEDRGCADQQDELDRRLAVGLRR